jgi:hypothetical protein
MKTIITSPSNALYNFKNFMFGFYLLVVSVSLPVLCFVQASYPGDKTDSKESVNQQQVSAQKTANTIGLRG